MKNAKEKAKELYSQFFCATPQPYTESNIQGLRFQDWDKEWTKNTAKKYCLIAVDEMIKQNGELYLSDLGEKAIEYYKEKNAYLFEVKSEIEKL